MSKINNSTYICDFVGCKKYLKEPITLPCGDMVCRMHVSDTATKFKCPNCEEDFIVPEEGFKVNGYFIWTLTDNFEWAEGYKPKFGLIHVDFNTQKRTIKDSGKWYRDFLCSTEF